MNSKFIRSVFLQFSGIVGAGIFTLPYLFYHSNFYFAVIGLIIIALVTATINIFYIDIVNSVPSPHQLSGYAEIYLGRRFKILAAFNLLLICIGSIFVYNQLATRFFLVFSPQSDFYLISFTFLFLVLITHLISQKRPPLFLDFLPVTVIFISLVFLSLALNLPPPPLELVSPNLIFIGAVIFAINGFTVIPEIPKKFLPQASLLGLFLVTLLYIIFTFSIITLSGPFLSADTISGLYHSSSLLASILSLFGLLITFKGSLNLLTVSHQIFYHDFNFKSSTSSLITAIISLLTIVLLKLTVSETISLLGSITVALSILIICFIHLKLPQTTFSKLTAYFVIAVFVCVLFLAVFS